MTGKLVATVFMLVATWQCHASSGVWLDIDTQRATLKVMEGNRERAAFRNISIGRSGTTRQKLSGDRKTPVGRFNIAWIKEKSRFRLFLGLNYPTLDFAYRAFRDGDIDLDDLLQIRRAVLLGKPPPQNTPLGGYIGIHGIGAGDPLIHRTTNWTNGCIALTNEQIEQLQHWVEVGTPVEIY